MYILVVDDDQFANALVQFVLSKEGFEVETLDNPRNAMQMISKARTGFAHSRRQHALYRWLPVLHEAPCRGV